MKSSIALVVLFAVIVLPIFSYLDAPPLQQWDESRLAISALEMKQSHNWIVTTYQRQPDMWSTKPPLMIWLQVLCMSIFGTNELAVRLPSAVSALGTCLLLFFFFSRKIQDPLAGLITGMIMVTSFGYVNFHGIRTGDYDSLLTLLMTAYAIAYLLYLDEGRRKYLITTFVLIALAVLTKGIQALIFTPALLLYTIYKKQILQVLREKTFYIGLAAFIAVSVGYYLLREHYNPGYIHEVLVNEPGRFSTAQDATIPQNPWYYFDLLISSDFKFWYLLVIPGIVAGIASRHKRLVDVTVFALLLAFTYLLVISLSRTKNCWYYLPLFPFLAVLCAIFLSQICNAIARIDGWRKVFTINIFTPCLLFFLFINPFRETLARVATNKSPYYISKSQSDMERFMKGASHGLVPIDSCSFIDQNILFTQNLYWYYSVIKIIHPTVKLENLYNLKENSKVVAYISTERKYIEDHYSCHLLQQSDDVNVYWVGAKRADVRCSDSSAVNPVRR